MTFAFVFDAGPFRVRKYESVVIGFDIRVEVVSEEQKANLWEILETRATIKSNPSSTSAKGPFCPPSSWPSLETAPCVPSLPSTTRQPSCYISWLGLG